MGKWGKGTGGEALLKFPFYKRIYIYNNISVIKGSFKQNRPTCPILWAECLSPYCLLICAHLDTFTRFSPVCHFKPIIFKAVKALLQLCIPLCTRRNKIAITCEVHSRKGLSGIRDHYLCLDHCMCYAARTRKPSILFQPGAHIWRARTRNAYVPSYRSEMIFR